MAVESLMSATQERPGRWLALFKRLYHSWATRSLAVGAVATAIDVVVLLTSLQLFRLFGGACDGAARGLVEGCAWHTTVGAMIGVTVGSTFTFFANRHFAFRDHCEKAAPQAVKFIVSTAVAMMIHGPLVGVLTNRFGVNVVLSKFAADILVFSVGQLFVLRYLVFPKRKDPPAEGGTPADEPSYSGGGVR